MSRSLHQTKKTHLNVARSRSSTSALASRAPPVKPAVHLLRGDIVSFCGGLVSRRLLEAGQLAHKHGTGRCSALDSAPSPPRRGSPPLRPPTFSRAARLFVCFSHRHAPHALHMHTISERFARRSRSGVTALFSLFEKAMLSASQDDITLRAPDWSPSAERPYLKKQSAQLLLLRWPNSN